jgi:hypothetical protein
MEFIDWRQGRPSNIFVMNDDAERQQQTSVTGQQFLRRSRESLNSRQVAVLQRIVHGGEPVTSRESALALSVYALRRRGLVETRWADGMWVARPTSAGRVCYEQLAIEPGTSPSTNTSKSVTRAPTNTAAASQAAILVAQVHAAGGSLRFADPDADTRAALLGLIQTAIQAGHRLHHTGRRYGDVVIALEAKPATKPDAAVDPCVNAPAGRPKTRRTHPFVSQLRALAATAGDGSPPDPRLPSVPVRAMPRALRVLNLLFVQAEARGYPIRAPSPVDRPHTVGIVVLGHEYRILLVEHGGILTLKLDGVYSGRRFWVDGKRTRLEQKLTDVFARLEEHAGQAERRRQEREHLAREAELARQTEIARYRIAYARDYAIGVLREQAAAWHLAEQIRALCVHVQGAAHAADQADTAKWITWALDHAEHIDPSRQPLAIPEVPEPSADDLDRYRDAPFTSILETP